MSFLRHGEIYRPMVAGKTPERPGCDRPGLIGTMSFRLAIPGGLPSGSARFRFTSHAQNALQWSCRSRIFQRTVNSVLFDCLSSGFHPNVCPAAQPEQISVTTGNLPGEQGFSVPIAVAVPYSSVTKLLNDYFQKNPKVSIGGDDVVIKDAYAADAGGHVLIALTLDGSIRGSVYLWGDPFADGTSLAIRNLHVETTTDDLLSAIKVGLAQLFLGDLGPRIEAVARIDLAPKIEKLKKKWSEKHELKAGSLTMAVERVDVSRAFSNPDYLAGWVVLEGTQAKLVLKTTP